MSDTLELESSWVGPTKLLLTLRNGALRFTDRVDPFSSRSRLTLMKGITAAIPSIDTDVIEAHLLQQVEERQQADKQAESAEQADPGQASDDALAKTPADVVSAACEMLHSPNLADLIVADLARIGIVGEEVLGMSLYMVGTSRLLAKPTSAIVQGGSSSGKSHTIASTASLFPAECKIMATDLTTNALYYLPPGALRHRFVVAGERSRNEDDDRAETTRALREMISEGVLRKLLPVKEGDTITTQVIESMGPIAFVESTTLAQIMEEDRNRCLLLASDDSPDQTRAVVRAIAERCAAGAPADTDRIRQVHHAAQRLLRRVDVRVPFASKLAEQMPVDRPEARRAIGQVLSMVQVAALLHQRQRLDDPHHGDVVTATINDYFIARQIVSGPLSRSLGSALPDHVRSFAEWVLSATKPNEQWTVAQLEGRVGCRWSRSSLFEYVKPLHTIGFLADAGTIGRSVLHRVAGPIPDTASTWLPDPEDLE